MDREGLMETDITITHVAQLIHILEQSINRGDCYGYGSKEGFHYPTAVSLNYLERKYGN